MRKQIRIEKRILGGNRKKERDGMGTCSTIFTIYFDGDIVYYYEYMSLNAFFVVWRCFF